MADQGFGMEPGALKSLLNKARENPINCAVGKGKEASAAYLMLDHAKQPKALETALSGKFDDAKDVRRGTVTIDADADAKMVLFHLNKPASGLAPRLVKILKKVGYSKVRFDFEDGSPSEALEEAEAQPAQASSMPAPSGPDAGALKLRLTTLAQGLGATIAANPAKRDALLALAKDARSLLGEGELSKAAAKMDELESAAQAKADAAAPAGPEAGAVAYAKSRLAWIGVRKRMVSDIDKLRDELVEFFKDEEDFSPSEVTAAFTERVEPVLSSLDESLADTLDDAVNTTDSGKRAELVATAREIIKRYQGFVASEPALAELDDNPFVPMKIQATLNATLATLSASIR